MPTEFSKCCECFYLESDTLDSYNYYKWDYDRMEALKHCGFPTEIAIKIVEMTKTYTECDYCANILCYRHRDLSLHFGNNCPYIQCRECYWNDVT